MHARLNMDTKMRLYFYSLGAGLLIGIVYSVLQVRSPAPPMVALVGLFGILVGEQVLPVVQQWASGCPLAAVWKREACGLHTSGRLQGKPAASPDRPARERPKLHGP
jgi:XapX domain-containing protein